MTKTNIATTWTRLLLAAGVVFAASAAAGYSGGDDGGPSPDYFRGHESGGPGKQLPVILMHKQALQQDGGFQYAFASDNGLRQGESIRPDGSRTGAYSYTDPDGKEISVKYTAGKDGFRIIQGDHVPKAPVSVVPLQQPALGGPAYAPPSPGRSGPGNKNRLFGAPGGPGSQFSRGDLSGIGGGGRYDHNSAEAAYAGPPLSGYKPNKFPRPQPSHYRVREENSAELAGRYEDDGSSSFDGAGDYSSHSPFRAPSSLAQNAAGPFGDGGSQKDDGPYDSNERQRPHTFGSGYAFEFGGNDAGAGGATTEF